MCPLYKIKGFTVQPIHRGVHCTTCPEMFLIQRWLHCMNNRFTLGLPLFLILILSSGNITYTNLPGNFKGLNLTWFCSPDFSVDVIFWDKDEAVDLERLWWSRMWDWSTLISWWKSLEGEEWINVALPCFRFFVFSIFPTWQRFQHSNCKLSSLARVWTFQPRKCHHPGLHCNHSRGENVCHDKKKHFINHKTLNKIERCVKCLSNIHEDTSAKIYGQDFWNFFPPSFRQTWYLSNLWHQ